MNGGLVERCFKHQLTIRPIQNTMILIVALLLLFGCQSVNQALNLPKPSARMTGLTFQDATLDSATLLFEVEVRNPYPVALPLANLDYNLSSGMQQFLKGQSQLQTIIPANNTKTVSLPVQINYLETLKALQGIKPGSQIPYEANLGLSVDAPTLGTMRLPLRKEGQIVLPKVSEIGVRDILDLIQ